MLLIVPDKLYCYRKNFYARSILQFQLDQCATFDAYLTVAQTAHYKSHVILLLVYLAFIS
jgi:hypothetical protein